VLQTGGCKDVYYTRLKQSVGGAVKLRDLLSKCKSLHRRAQSLSIHKGVFCNLVGEGLCMSSQFITNKFATWSVVAKERNFFGGQELMHEPKNQ